MIKIKKDINNFKYNILMILTDGIIDDIKETIDQLVEGSFLPLSVIIIGVGNTDFSKRVYLMLMKIHLKILKEKKFLET